MKYYRCIGYTRDKNKKIIAYKLVENNSFRNEIAEEYTEQALIKKINAYEIYINGFIVFKNKLYKREEINPYILKEIDTHLLDKVFRLGRPLGTSISYSGYTELKSMYTSLRKIDEQERISKHLFVNADAIMEDMFTSELLRNNILNYKSIGKYIATLYSRTKHIRIKIDTFRSINLFMITLGDTNSTEVNYSIDIVIEFMFPMSNEVICRLPLVDKQFIDIQGRTQRLNRGLFTEAYYKSLDTLAEVLKILATNNYTAENCNEVMKFIEQTYAMHPDYFSYNITPDALYEYIDYLTQLPKSEVQRLVNKIMSRRIAQ